MKLEASLENNDIETSEVIEIYKANGWSAAEKPESGVCQDSFRSQEF